MFNSVRQVGCNTGQGKSCDHELLAHKVTFQVLLYPANAYHRTKGANLSWRKFAKEFMAKLEAALLSDLPPFRGIDTVGLDGLLTKAEAVRREKGHRGF